MGQGTVFVRLSRPREFLNGHEGVTLLSVARGIARLKGYDFGGCHDSERVCRGASFFVPDETLVRAEAEALGVREAGDVFGGIVARPFLKTKVITHELVGADAARPDGWLPAFGRRVRDVVVPGYTAFSRADAREAAKRLLHTGDVRAKRPESAGARGQHTLTGMTDVDRLLETVSDDELATQGLVVEANLDPVTTLSVGLVTLGDAALAYHGRQRLTRDNAGREVYGGSDLICVLGGWAALHRLPVDDVTRRAIDQARAYDAATAEYDVVASRRNYDVGIGVDGVGQKHSGVFEASWRCGGASPAEVAALEAFAADPSLEIVRASTFETYGTNLTPPRDAAIHFHGVDPIAGPLARYTVAQADRRAA